MNYRLNWQKLQVVYKFIEHVILENTALLAYLVPYAKRLNFVSTIIILLLNVDKQITNYPKLLKTEACSPHLKKYYSEPSLIRTTLIRTLASPNGEI